MDWLSYYGEYYWWVNQLKRNILIHPVVAKFITEVLNDLRKKANKDSVLRNLSMYYTEAVSWWQNQGGTKCEPFEFRSTYLIEEFKLAMEE